MDWTLVAVALVAVAVVTALWVVARDGGHPTRARRAENGTQEASVVVLNGYRPSRIELDVGVPTVLRFERIEDDPCSELLVSELWPSAHRLAPHADTFIRFTPQRPGRFAFTCGMGMYSGEFVIR